MTAHRFQKFLIKNKNGFGIVEILIMAAIISISLVAIAGVGNFSLKISSQLKKDLIATGLTNEALEATRAIKEGSWPTLAAYSVNTVYHPAKTGNPLIWSLVPGNEDINGFSRRVIIENVYRDTNDDITLAGGTLDPNTKKITAIVAWSYQGRDYQTAISSYLANWKP